MFEDGGPKSAFELAMERLRKQDADEGVTTRASLTDEQKAAIAEVRSLYDSKIAEQEILQASAMKHLQVADPAEREEVERRFRRERERLASERDAKVGPLGAHQLRRLPLSSGKTGHRAAPQGSRDGSLRKRRNANLREVLECRIVIGGLASRVGWFAIRNANHHSLTCARQQHAIRVQ